MSVELMGKVWKMDLPTTKKFILLALADHADDDGNNVYPSVKHVANKCGLSPRQCQRVLKELRDDDGLLILVSEAGENRKTNEYRIDLSRGVNMSPSPDTHVTPGVSPVSPKPSIEPSENHNPEGSGENARTDSQKLMDRFYDKLKTTHNVRLTKERYSFHLGKFRDILNVDEATEDEQDRVIVHMAKVYPKAPKINAVDALNDVRLGRDTGEAWSGPAPWEEAEANNQPTHPHSEEAQEMRDKPRKPEWYIAFYPNVSTIAIRDWITAGSTHTEITRRLESTRVQR